MTDLEITKLCAEAMGLLVYYPFGGCPYIRWTRWFDRDTSDEDGALKSYQPLDDDTQAMALVKKFHLDISAGHGFDGGVFRVRRFTEGVAAESTDLNRAICECVAKMQKAKAHA